MKKRIVNNRPILFFAIALICGLFLASFHYKNYAILILTLALTFIAAGVLLIVNKNKFVYIPVAIALGTLLFVGTYGFYQIKLYNNKNITVRATVSSEIIASDNGYYFIVENITADDQSLKGKSMVFTYLLPESRAGDEIEILGDISTKEYVVDSYFMNNYRNKIYYEIYADEVISLGEGNLNFSTKLKINLKRLLHNAVDNDTAEITTALIYGDKFGFDDENYMNIRNSGLAHILAVSGLHISILAGAIYFLCSKLKIGRWPRFVSVTILLLLYGGLCGFPASIIRATVMIVVFMLADCLGKKADPLSALAIAAVIVLIFNPTDVFCIGFQLSFVSVLGLFAFAKPIENKLSKLPKMLSGIISASLAVNISIWPILAFYFDSVQLLFIISNLLILPILPFIYIISLIICCIVQLIPIFSPLLKVLTVIDWPIIIVSRIIGGLSLSSINLNVIGCMAIGYLLILAICSRFVFLTKRTKIIASLSVSSLSLTLSVVLNCLL